MESYLTEEAIWANGLASRLRLIQANFADDQVPARQNYLVEEIERGLKGVIASKRKDYLHALAEKFPAWEGAPAAGGPAESKAPAQPETPENLLARLLEAAPSLSADARAELGKKLQQAGLGVKEQAAGSMEFSAEWRKKFNIMPEASMEGQRVAKLFTALSEMALGLDQLSWALWKQVAPQSNIRKEGEFSKLAGSYLGGSVEVSTTQVTQLLEKTRRLTASLLGAIGRGSNQYAKGHLDKFSPEAIEDLAKIEKKPWESLESVSWRKYKELARERISEPAIENEIQKAIAKAAEDLMVGRGLK